MTQKIFSELFLKFFSKFSSEFFLNSFTAQTGLFMKQFVGGNLCLEIGFKSGKNGDNAVKISLQLR